MVRIRLKRTGRINRPSFRICVFDAKTRRDGKTIEDLGFYDAFSDKKQSKMRVDVDRARYWISHGAKPTTVVHQIFKRNGVYAS